MCTWVSACRKRRTMVQLACLIQSRNLFVRNDFVAAIINLMRHNLSAHIPMVLLLGRLLPQAKQKTKCLHLYYFQLHHWSSLMTGILHERIRDINIENDSKKHQTLSTKKKCFGGYRNCVFKFEFIEPFITSDTSKIDTTSHFKFMDHVSDIKLLNYPSDQYIHANIPLHVLCELFPATKARKIASTHGVSAGSRCTPAELIASTMGHCCLACTKYSSVFIPTKTEAQLCQNNLYHGSKTYQFS